MWPLPVLFFARNSAITFVWAALERAAVVTSHENTLSSMLLILWISWWKKIIALIGFCQCDVINGLKIYHFSLFSQVEYYWLQRLSMLVFIIITIIVIILLFFTQSQFLTQLKHDINYQIKMKTLVGFHAFWVSVCKCLSVLWAHMWTCYLGCAFMCVCQWNLCDSLTFFFL